jgi:short subunit dehydrogenase-like uncharacterized protein
MFLFCELATANKRRYDGRLQETMMPERSEWMLYGAYGKTGRLILHEALRRGHKPLLAGRDGARLEVSGGQPAWPREPYRSTTAPKCARHCQTRVVCSWPQGLTR